MAQPGAFSIVQHYHTTTALATPAPANVSVGELAINVTDRKIYTKDGGGSIVPLGNVGDVTLNGVQTLTNKTITSVVLDGTPVAPTQATSDNSTKVATTAYVNSVAFSPVLPAQSIATTNQFLQSTGASGIVQWNEVYPSQTSNNGKFLQTNGTTTSWAFAGISQVTTATTATTLTSTPTLLQITPASYGVTVTLPDATTCSVGGPLHCIDNRGAFPVRVCDSTGTLKGFVFAGVVSYISLDDNSTAAGVWAIGNNELVGASAQLLTTQIINVSACIDIGSNREVVIGGNTPYAVVYDKATNTFGTPVLVRAVSVGAAQAAVLSAANQILFVSCSSTTAFEAVTLSISGTTITVNTPATATLSANISEFADGCGLIAVGSSFVTSYTVATPAAQIRAMSISGTTVTIGAATVLDGTAGGLIAASGSVVLAASTTATDHHIAPYTVSGTTLTLGTGATVAAGGGGSGVCKKFAPLLSGRWFFAFDGNGDNRIGVASLAATTVTMSTINTMIAATLADAIVVGSNKVLVLGNSTSSNANILTDTAGTASAGTAITLNSNTSRTCLYASGANVAVQSGTTNYNINTVDCSGASPVRTSSFSLGTQQWAPAIGASNSVLTRSANTVFGTAFAQTVFLRQNTAATTNSVRVKEGTGGYVFGDNTPNVGVNFYRGKADSERWIADATTVITKVECVV